MSHAFEARKLEIVSPLLELCPWFALDKGEAGLLS